MRNRFNRLVRREDEEDSRDTLPVAESWAGEYSPATHRFAIDLATRKQQPPVELTVEEEG